MDAYDIMRLFAKLFNLPTRFFKFPDVIFYFIIPFIAIVFLFYNLLNKKFRIFRNSGINLIIAAMMALFSSFGIAILPPALTVSMVAAFTILVLGRFTWKRVALVLIVFMIIQWIYPFVMNLFL